MYQTPGVIVAIVALARASPCVTKLNDPPRELVRSTRALGEKSLQVCDRVTVRFAKVVVSSWVNKYDGRMFLPMVVSLAPTVIFVTCIPDPTIAAY